MEPIFSGLKTFMKRPYVHMKNTYVPPDVYIVGIPYDIGTSNRPGARFGPAGIRDASHMLCTGANPNFKLNPFKRLNVYDVGDIEFSTNTKKALKDIEMAALHLTEHGSHLISLGGDHTIALPLLRSIKKRHGKVAIVHFDAHVDTWSDDNGEKYRHGTPFHFAAKEKLIDTKHSVQIGIRSPINQVTMDYTQRDLGFHVIPAKNIHLAHSLDEIINGIKRRIGDRKVYMTFDIDCIDPSQAPGTGTPEIGGLFTWQVLHIMESIKDLNWVGMDMVEVAPAYDNAQITSLAAATFICTYLCMIASKKNTDNTGIAI